MKALYSAASGMAAQQLRLDNVANNLANVNTTGFKKSRQAFQDLFYQQVGSVEIGGGVRTAATNRDMTSGGQTATGNVLDFAIEGDGFFVVEDAEGTPLYTRDGSFTVDGEGTLVNMAGLRVAGDISVPADVQSLSVLEDGTVTAVLGGDTSQTVLGQLELATFVNPGGLEARGGNTYAQTPESGDPQAVEAGDASVRQGYLEGSNVDVAEELIEMIMAQRSFELNSKAVQAADETMQVAVNLRR